METQRLWQALQLKRDAYVWMQFNQAANGDAVLIVAGVYAFWVLFAWILSTSGIPFLAAGSFLIRAIVGLFISGAFAWVIGSGAVWLISNYIFESHVRFGSIIPITGYAHAPLILVPVAARLNFPAALAMLFAGIWAAAMMVTGFQSNLDMKQERAIGSALVALLAWVLFVGIR
jgi:hypothetical protein